MEFTIEQVREYADELSRKISELEQKQLDKKDIMKSIAAGIAKIESEISSLATKVKDKYEFRMVSCEVVFDYETKEKSYTRMDSGEVFKTLPMTDEELQMKF